MAEDLAARGHRTRRLVACLAVVLPLVAALVALPATAPASAASGNGQLAATSVTAAWPATHTIRERRRAVVTGRVSSGPRRTVELQHLANNGWEALARTTTSGAYALRIPTTWYTTHRLRIHVPATGTHAAATAANGTTLRVRPRYSPRGSARAFDLVQWRFDPCRTIRYRVNRRGMPKGAIRDVKRAARVLSKASGLRLKYAGGTRIRPLHGRRMGDTSGGPSLRGFELAIGWATPRQVPALEGNIVGLGGPTAGIGRDAKGFVRTTQAQVVLDSTYRLRRGFGRGFSRGELMLHEIGHALGLEHAMRRHQVMSYNTLRRDVLGAGDLAGLQAIGRSAGCFADADPYARPMPVEPPAPDAYPAPSVVQ